MACTLPTVEKTWEFSSVVVPYTNDTDGRYRREVLLAIKNVLINASDFTSPWVVESGCDKNTAINNNPATADLWINYGDIIWEVPGYAHSWMVLKQSGISGIQLCLDAIGNRYYPGRELSIAYSFTGFGAVNGGTDGTTLVRPTATDERTIIYPAYSSTPNWCDALSPRGIVHVQMSDDGECTRWQIAGEGHVSAFFLLEPAKDPLTGTPGWPEAFGGVYLYLGGAEAASYAEGNDAAQYKTFVDGNAVAAYITSLGDGSAASGQNQTVANELTSCWEMYECGLWASDSETISGRLGKLRDLRWVSTGLSVSDMFPQSGTLYQWVCIGDMMIPWNQTDAIYDIV